MFAPAGPPAKDGPHPTVKLGANGTTRARSLTSRGTSVPFTAVPTGPQRTTTDSTLAPTTCAVPIPAGDDSARSGFGSKGSCVRELDSRQRHPSRCHRLPTGGITYAVVVVKGGTRTCPLAVRRQERVAAQLSTAPLRGPNSTQQRAESSEHLPPVCYVRFKGLITCRGEQGYEAAPWGTGQSDPVRGGPGRNHVRDRTRPSTPPSAPGLV